MTLRFDHAVIAVRDLEAASQTYTQLGFSVEGGGRHTGKGTRNTLVRFPENYLELLAVDDRDEALAAGASRRDLVRYLDQHAAGLTTFALRTGAPDELDAFAARWRAAGFEVAGPNPAERRRPDGTILRWRTAVPGGSSVRRPWPFLIEWPDGALEGAPAPGSHPNGALGVAEIAVAVADDSVLDRLGFEGSTLPGHVRSAAIDVDGAGPLQVGIRMRDLDEFEERLAQSGFATEPAWLAGLRLSAPPPEASMLVFLPASFETTA
jgi:catechol 2,3-dioxygenase-like lactoylglutathione lyase family enzyme